MLERNVIDMTTQAERETLAQVAPGIIAYANTNHVNELLKLVHAFGGCTWATDARLEQITLINVELRAINGTREQQIRIDFAPPLAQANHARQSLIELIERADLLLGAEPPSGRNLPLTHALHRYLQRVSLREPAAARALREEMAREPDSDMQIGPEQGQLLALLLKLLNARRTIEVGVFMGYSTLWTALTLPEDGQIIACDVSEEWTSIGRRYWTAAGVAHKIDLRLAPAGETLQTLLIDGQAGQFDFAFIDADKTGYDMYYEQCLQLVRSGG
jgi:predicted O-methyltransferase YrrM